MTSQDGIPIPGPCTFLCPCSAVIVSWKPSTCSESWVGAFRQTIVAERICDGEEDISICCMEARVLWDVLTPRAAASALVSREMASGKGPTNDGERLRSLHCDQDSKEMLHDRGVHGKVSWTNGWNEGWPMGRKLVSEWCGRLRK